MVVSIWSHTIRTKKRGVKFGRPSKLNSEQKSLMKRLLSEGESIKSIAKTHPSTIYRNLKT
ncbi:helix-turn-helix domain-containing protein [Candidatus Odyssella thessalonicensis]|uniref:helix-turn-helix domain-containing protein n=1 Tax=Candidatus Odyssella thessalonicensis TaxID=84647 RepID=UPI00247A5A36|nr:helix-turn-helix domain-containing protein [Candidatus Odyssella thessalonicensis]